MGTPIDYSATPVFYACRRCWHNHSGSRATEWKQRIYRPTQRVLQSGIPCEFCGSTTIGDRFGYVEVEDYL